MVDLFCTWNVDYISFNSIYRMAESSEAEMHSDNEYNESPGSSTSLVSEVHDAVEKLDAHLDNLLKTVKTRDISDVSAVINNIERGPEDFQIKLRQKFKMVKPVEIDFDEPADDGTDAKAAYSETKCRFVSTIIVCINKNWG